VISGTAAASDIDSTLLTYSLVQPASHGTVSVNPDGSYSYTPQLNYFGPDSFTFRASDGTVDSNVATVALTVTPVNDAPRGKHRHGLRRRRHRDQWHGCCQRH
jgi:VCBS repeat-containing protein